MALHPDFPKSPYVELVPEQRWFPAAEELRTTAYERLLPPLVANIRREVSAWRQSRYAGASDTSRSLLTWWFEAEHLTEAADGTLSPFRYYFAQREAVETVIWLHDVRKVRDKFDLMRFDASGVVSTSDNQIYAQVMSTFWLFPGLTVPIPTPTPIPTAIPSPTIDPLITPTVSAATPTSAPTVSEATSEVTVEATADATTEATVEATAEATTVSEATAEATTAP